MSHLPTLIIMATPAGRPSWVPEGAAHAQAPALPDFQHIAQTLDVALEADMPVVLLASRWVQQQCEVFAPEVTCVDVNALAMPQPGPDQRAQAVASGVQASAQCSGWLVMPWPMWQVKPQTLRTLADAVRRHPMVCPVHRMQSGQPVGLSAEFYSELSGLGTAAQWRRLWARYPVTPMEVDDPGVLVAEDSGLWHHGVAQGQLGQAR
jgi:CTP:molybdopterin cytidylyltransferase MocA